VISDPDVSPPPLPQERSPSARSFNTSLVWALIGLVAPSHVAGWTGWSAVRVTFVAAGILITVFGLVACSQANARGDDRGFLERYLCL
jgi:hypothetical protein